MSFLFGGTPQPTFSPIPEIDDEEIERAKRQALAAQHSGGRSATILSGGFGPPGPVMGSSASLTGAL